jgi:hypothetical protein
MAGQYRFKDSCGNIVAQISASADGTISFSGSTANFSQINSINLGSTTITGTADNSNTLNGYSASAFVFTSSFNPFSSSVSSQLTTLQTVSGSNIGRLNSLESKSSSVDISITNINTFTSSTSARLNSIETISASNLSRIGSLETISASNISRINSLETVSASNISRLNSLENKTGSLATTGSNIYKADQTITGSLYISQNLVVQGSSSIQYISQSTLNIGTNLITVNSVNPSSRFSGLAAIDSGSSPQVSGSLLFDSVDNEWIFVHQIVSGAALTSSIMITGPETYNNLGNETRLSTNIIPKVQSGFHIVDSCIVDDGTTTCVKNNLIGTGTITGTTTYSSTISCSPIGCFGTACATSFIGGTMSGTTNYASTIACSPIGCFGTSCAGAFVGGTLSGTTLYGSTAVCSPSILSSGTVCSTGNACFGGNNIIGGKIGIGTSTPCLQFTVYNSTTGDGVGGIRIDRACNVNTEANIQFSTAGNIKWWLQLNNDSTDNLYVFDNVGGTVRTSWLPNGNVGINTACPTSILHVYCDYDVWHTRIGSSTGELRIGGQTACGAVIQSYTPAGVVRDLYLQRDGGKIGIGTNSALAKVHIYASCPNGAGAPNANTLLLIDSDNHQLIEMRTCSSAYGAMQGIAFTDNGLNGFIGYKEYTCQTAGTFGEALHIAVYDYSGSDPNNGIYFGTSTTPNCGVSKPLMFIKGDGKIGIGTCTPSFLLDICGNTGDSNTGMLRLGSPTGATLRMGVSCCSYSWIQSHGSKPLYINELGNNVIFFCQGSGAMGLGTASPESTLHINGVSAGGYAASITLTNCSNTAGTSTGIDFGVDNSTAGAGLGNAQIKVCNIGGSAGSNCSDMIFTMWNGSTFDERFRIKDKRNILIDTGNNAAQVNTATPSALRFNNDYSSGYTDGSLKLYLFNSGATIHGFTSGPIYDIQYHSSGDATNSRHVFYTNNTAKLSIHPNAVCPSVPIISTANYKAHTYCVLTTSIGWCASVTGNVQTSFSTTGLGLPSGVKALQVLGWYHITGYSGGAGQGDHAVSLFGTSTDTTPYPWSGPGGPYPYSASTFTRSDYGSFVLWHDGDASNANTTNGVQYYGLMDSGIINVNSNGSVYANLATGYSGGTHYIGLWIMGYWI